jgi:hypothetical protein|tara:strand:+ start:916 stop:1350 length:435 start_codon:yes stop_codon:yes gene_type:complete
MSDEKTLLDPRVDDFAGIDAKIDIGLKLTSSIHGMVAMTKSLTAIFGTAEQVPVGLVGLSQDSRAVSLTFAISLGSLNDIRNASQPSIDAMNLMSQIVDDLSAYEPVLTALPAIGSEEERAAQEFLTREHAPAKDAARVFELVG